MLKKNKTSKKIKTSSRRKFIKTAVATTTVAASITMPNVSLGAPVTLKMQAAWQGKKNIFFEMAKDYEKRVNEMAGGSMKLEVLPRGAIVEANKITDAVSEGVVDAGHTATVYWYNKNNAAILFGGGPTFGFSSQELIGWIEYGGGRKLLEEIFRSLNLNIISFFAMPSPAQPLGWFEEHINKISKIKDVEYRTSGIVTDVTESFGTNFTPAIFSWLKPSLNYSSSYRWSDPINSTREGANITSQARTSSSLTLSPKAIIETVYSPPKKSGSSSRRRGRRGGAQKDKKEEETKKPKSEGLQKILGILYDGASKINPISITYSESRSQNALGVIDSVWSGDSMKVVSGTASIPFRLGLTDELGLNSSSDVGVNTGSLSRQKDMTLRSGLSLTRKITTTFSYGNNQSWGVDGNNVETRSKTQDFVPLGDTGNEGLALPSWTLRWSGVENWPFIKWVAKSASLDHAFSGKQTQSWQNNELRSSKYTASFSPLVGISMTMVKGISLTTRYSNIKSIDNTLGGLNSTRVNLDKTWTASTNYSHKGGLKIPIFFFRDFNLENTINFTLTVDYSSSETRQREGTTGKLPITGWQNSWKLSPKITYSFTKRVTGGIWYEYRESEAQTVGRKIDRDFGFDVNIAIQG